MIEDPNVERIPIVEESLFIEKTLVQTGKVRVQTFVDEQQVVLRDTVRREHVEVERVPIGREVETAPEVREEGEFLIVPVVEERLVIVKRFFVVEEIRLRRAAETVPVELPATRRVMRAEVHRQAGAPAPDSVTSPISAVGPDLT